MTQCCCCRVSHDNDVEKEAPGQKVVVKPETAGNAVDVVCTGVCVHVCPTLNHFSSVLVCGGWVFIGYFGLVVFNPSHSIQSSSFFTAERGKLHLAKK